MNTPTQNIKIKLNVNGILLLDKQHGISSNGALQQVKRLFKAKKAGHTGSLDPLATGMLPICFGEATKFSQFLLESDKQYSVTAKLGVETTTGDAEGEIIRTTPINNITLEKINPILKKYLGTIKQIPPMYSAIKYKGTPLYELARQGIEVERSAREVQIYQLNCSYFKDDILTLEVHCSKGTYVRTLIEVIGKELGCGAHVIALRRGFVNPYDKHKMYNIQELESISIKGNALELNQLLLPLETSVHALPAIYLSPAMIFYIKAGQPILVPRAPSSGMVRIFTDSGLFVGVGEIIEDGRVAPRRLVARV